MAHNFSQECAHCGCTIRGNDEEDLMVNVKRHHYKRHPVVYSLAQNYSEIKGDVLQPKERNE